MVVSVDTLLAQRRLPTVGQAQKPPLGKRYARGGFDVKYGKVPVGTPRLTTMTGAGAVTPAGKTAEQIAAEWLAAHGGGGGGYTGVSQAQEIAVARENARLQAEADAAQRSFQAQQDAIQRQFLQDQEAQQRAQELKVQTANLQAQRQQTYVELLGRDPARAILFALGYGPEHDVFTTEAQRLGITLQPLAGAAQGEQTTEGALSKLLGGKVDIGQYGVQGLGAAPGAARQFMQGGADVQRLLTSAFGVGSTAPGEQPGISPDRLLELLQSVTPTGNL